MKKLKIPDLRQPYAPFGNYVLPYFEHVGERGGERRTEPMIDVECFFRDRLSLGGILGHVHYIGDLYRKDRSLSLRQLTRHLRFTK